jgi:hypothetical protein
LAWFSSVSRLSLRRALEADQLKHFLTLRCVAASASFSFESLRNLVALGSHSSLNNHTYLKEAHLNDPTGDESKQPGSETSDTAQATRAKAPAIHRVLLVIIAAILVLEFLFARPASQARSMQLNVLHVIQDVLMMIGLGGFGFLVLRSDKARRGRWAFVIVTGLLAGFALLSIHLSGGRHIAVSEHSIDSSSHLEGLPKELRDLIDQNTELVRQFDQSHYGQIKNPRQLRSLSRQDFQDARAIFAKLSDCQQRIINSLEQAESQHIDISSVTTDRILLNPEVWRAQHQIYSSLYQQAALVEQNYDEWVAHPMPDNDSESKPWQRELRRLQKEIVAAQERGKTLAP